MKEEKRRVFIRHELRKMYENWHTSDQMIEMVRKEFANGTITLDDIIEWLVYSRWNDITYENKLKEIKKISDSILFLPK